jgi:Ca-activated chloride channel homolog
VTFLAPERLWLLLAVPILLLVYVGLQRRRSSYAVRFTNLALLDRIAPRRPAWGRHIAVGLCLLSVAMIVVAFAKPTEPTRVPLERATVVVTIDESLSMGASDVSPTRLDAAKNTAKSFIQQLPTQFNVSVIAFARSAAILVAPTLDRSAAFRAIDGMHLAEYTATGEALFTSLDAIKLAPPDAAHPDEPAPGRIVLISDGKKTFGRSPYAAARLAKRRHIPVFTIAVGTKDAVIDSHGQQIPVPVNQSQLKRIAQLAGGQSYIAGSSKALSAVYDNLSHSFGYTTQEREITARFVGYALVLVLGAAIAVVLYSSRLSS